MKLLLAVVVLSVWLGYLLGGRLHHLEAIRPRWWGLVLLGLAIQFVPLPEGGAGTDLIVFGLVNVRMPGMFLVIAGLACNMTVIVVNGGMPASAQALIDSGQEDVLAYLQDQGADKHHLLTDDDQLTFLADIIAVPEPIGQAVSVGDIILYAGLAWLIVAAMRGWTPSARPAGSGPRRGKHRRGAAREPEPLPDFGFLPPGATTSGTGR
jgi:hypothetical protein